MGTSTPGGGEGKGTSACGRGGTPGAGASGAGTRSQGRGQGEARCLAEGEKHQGCDDEEVTWHVLRERLPSAFRSEGEGPRDGENSPCQQRGPLSCEFLEVDSVAVCDEA